MMKENINIISRLKDYFDLKEGVIQEIKHSKNLHKGFLAASLPLLAVGSAIAQCQGAKATNLTIQENGEAGGLNIDVDGDNVDDFVIFDPAFTCCSGGNLTLLIKPLNSARALTSGGKGTALRYGNGQAINGNNVNTYGGAQWLAFSYNGAYGNFGRPFPKSGYIGIVKNGKYGFIQLTVNSGPESSGQSSGTPFVISISEAGLQDANQNVLAGNCSTLPVEMTDFRIKAEARSAALKWTTASEVNNSGFEIERSNDGESFKHIGFVEGKGISSRKVDYNFLDKGLIAGKSYYYRLKQIDYNGRHEYSDILNITLKGSKDVLGDIYPNPSNQDVVYINADVERSSKWQVEILNVSGQVLKSFPQELSPALSQIKISTNELPNGTYFVKVNTDQSAIYKKLIVQK